ncbi:cytochrome AA3 biosynthesis protein [Halovenus sp. WSH3]|uniref:Cytochrome AA3 biosynthesis protein n=1 Tax=Halovenus carboxidivorans TaxID=2692199 RepID=A0A6B0T577_9EURY|nr:cytochrome AA3 biosynthesis protein [Halovenus carboxidivorans]
MAATTVGTFGLILLGVYTGKIGAGLTCAGRWPFCDGWLGLFPATWPSFVEWFHRLVAMVVGFMILGAGLIAWRGEYDTRITYALGVAVVMLPLQILFGANTVLNFGITASMLHQTAAQLIFASLVYATALSFWTASGRPTESTTEADTETAVTGD